MIKKRILLSAALMVAGIAQATITKNFQLGGNERQQTWAIPGDGVSTASYTIIAPEDPDLQITVSLVSNHPFDWDGTDPGELDNTAFVAVNDGVGSEGRLDGDETITVTVSYVDPNSRLFSLKLKEFGAYWGNNSTETTVFTDASANAFSVTAFDHGVSPEALIDYSTTGLDALTKDNTATWSMTVSVDDTLGETSSALGGFELEYEIDTGFDDTGYFKYKFGGPNPRDQSWGSDVVTNNAVTPTEYSQSFQMPDYYLDDDPSLTNIVFTVTAVETNDLMFTSTTHLAGAGGKDTRLDGDDFLKLTVSYVDPDHKLLDLRMDSFGTVWNTGPAEETIFSDGVNEYAVQYSDNTDLFSYDLSGLTQLSLNNTGSWEMLVYTTNGVTESGMGAFKLAYLVDTPFVEEPVPPHGDVVLGATWTAVRAELLGESSEYFSAVFTNNTAGENSPHRRIFQDGLVGPVQVGETVTWSFTAIIGTNLAVSGGYEVFRGSIWDDGSGGVNNGVGFRLAYGPTGTNIIARLGRGNTSSSSIGTANSEVESIEIPTILLLNQDDLSDIVLTLKRASETETQVTLRYDDIMLAKSYSDLNFDSVDAIGFKMHNELENHLIITNVLVNIDQIIEATDTFSFWTVENELTFGVNDGFGDDPDSDGMDNLLEYALGGDPLLGDTEILPVETVDSTYFNYVYSRRTDAATRGLTYDVNSTPNLVFEPLTNATEFAGSVDVGGGFESATNRVPTATENVQFMELTVELTE